MKFDFEAINKVRRSRGIEPLPIPIHSKRGRPAGPKPAKAELKRLYVKDGLSIRETAKALGMKRDMVRRILRDYGIKPRGCAKRSRLRAYSLDTIEKTIKEGGMKKAAATLGVSLRALQYYRAGLRKKDLAMKKKRAEKRAKRQK